MQGLLRDASQKEASTPGMKHVQIHASPLKQLCRVSSVYFLLIVRPWVCLFLMKGSQQPLFGLQELDRLLLLNMTISSNVLLYIFSSTKGLSSTASLLISCSEFWCYLAFKLCTVADYWPRRWKYIPDGSVFSLEDWAGSVQAVSFFKKRKLLPTCNPEKLGEIALNWCSSWMILWAQCSWIHDCQLWACHRSLLASLYAVPSGLSVLVGRETPRTNQVQLRQQHLCLRHL